MGRAAALEFAAQGAALMALSDGDWHFTITNELDIVWFSVRAAWPELVSRGGGSIINVASIGQRTVSST